MRELKYRTIDTATSTDINNFEKIRRNEEFRPLFHVNPPFGLLNDPNGFCYFNGKYHLFYQWFPFGTFHGLKHWMHLTSNDLYQWVEEGTKIIPSDKYESHGAYSGSALIDNDNAYLFYTGNIKSKDSRDANQCLAVLDNKDGVTKSINNPIIKSVPKGYTGHVRDPKVIKQDDQYMMILGAQREEDLKGCIIVYRSSDLVDWTFVGELSVNVEGCFDQAYMFECPDMLKVDGKDVLIFSPQGIEASGDRFNNRYNVVYCVGQVDWPSLTFTVEHWDELDRGFDFYAPQTMANSPNEPTLIAWAGTDEKLPTQELGWVNTLTLPRTLVLKNNRLYQQPFNKVEGIKRTKVVNKRVTKGLKVKLDSLSFELNVSNVNNVASVSIVNEIGQAFVFEVNNSKDELIMSRENYNHNKHDYEFGNIRKVITEENSSNFKLICDQSIVEVFVENGRDVFTSLFFPSNGNHYLDISLESETEVDINLQYLTI